MEVRQTILIDCPAHAVYAAFTDADEHAEITGAAAHIDPRVGGAYGSYDDAFLGEFTHLDPDHRIVMQWRSTDEDWPDDHWAVISLGLEQSSDGTTIEFVASDVPSEFAEAVDQLWEEMFWQPMQRALAI